MSSKCAKKSSSSVFPLKKKRFIKKFKPVKRRKRKRDRPWISELGLHLYDKRILLSSTSWLHDKIINPVQKLLMDDYPAVRGLQDVTHGLNMTFNIERGEFVQILHDGANHWFTISTVEFSILKWKFMTANIRVFPLMQKSRLLLCCLQKHLKLF